MRLFSFDDSKLALVIPIKNKETNKFKVAHYTEN